MTVNNTFRLIIDCEENIVVTVLAKLVSLYSKSVHALFFSYALPNLKRQKSPETTMDTQGMSKFY